MVRKINNNKGITLIEIIVVVAIVAIILGMSVPYYTKWKKRVSIESDTKRIYGVIQNFRSKAFAEKTEYKVKLSDKKVEIYQNNKPIYSLSLENNFKFTGSSTTEIKIDQRGTFSGSSIYAEDYKQTDAQYDCIAINNIRVRLGKMSEGGRCVAK